MDARRLRVLTIILLGSAAAFLPVTAFAAPPTCSALATDAAYGLAGNAVVSQTASDNQGIASPSAVIVAATATNNAYCYVNLQYSAESGPTSGYASGESQTIGISISLPLNSTDGGTPGNSKGSTWTAVDGAWNGKIENMGGGGFAGTIGPETTATNTGYVGSFTDGGHNSAQNGSDGNFGILQATNQLDVGKTIDMASESVHQQYLWALAIANSYYGQPATRNYWNGCSTGGRQGLELAQLYGQDFDGFLVGSPVVMWDAFDFAGKVWASVVNRDDIVGNGATAVTTAQFQNGVSHAIAACDVEGTDVVQDGVVDDPLECKYKAETDTTILTAPDGTCNGATCLSLAQAQGVDKMWQDGALEGGDRNHAGARFWWGLFPTIHSPSGGVGPNIGTGSTNPERVYDWDHHTTSGDVQNVYSTRALAQSNPLAMPNPTSVEDEMLLNQSPLPASQAPNGVTTPVGRYFYDDSYQGLINNVYLGPKQGKIMLWEGWNDTNPWPQNVIRYYKATATLVGGGTPDYTDLWTWFRYYHAPGVGHCGGDVGASPSNVTGADGFNEQMFLDLVNWVENEVPPQSGEDYTHLGTLGEGSVGTRPVCPYPTTAIYNGSGSTSVASNYHCGGNLDLATPTPQTNNVATACKIPVTAFGNTNTNLLNWQEVGVNPEQCPQPFQVDTHDFFGLGTSDILWRDTSGNLAVWEVNGSNVANGAMIASGVPATWSIVGQRDFTAGGYSDVLWRDTSGDVAIWLMNGSAVQSAAVIGNVPTNWTVVGTGDFNNSGYGDILWEDTSGNLAMWIMNGTTISQVVPVGNVPTNWSVAGTDSKGDIFWRNLANGDLAIWVMQGGTVAQSVDLGIVPLSWTVAGIGDFDGNGSADLLWRDTSGNLGVWLMNGTQVMSYAGLGNVPLNWTIAETGDFSGVGRSGILWIDNVGDVGIWFLNGGTVSSLSSFGNVGTAWAVQGLNAD